MSVEKSKTGAILPGACIGMLGGGQLGRMSILAGRRLGYRFRVYDPSPGGPAAMVADAEVIGAFDDVAALGRFAAGLDVATLEFENVSKAAVAAVSAHAPVHPSAGILAICQNRKREKTFFRDNGFPCVDFRIADSEESFRRAVEVIGFPCVAKTTSFGYDGKGQRKLEAADEVEAAWASFAGVEVIVEAWADFEGEFSVICSRNGRGETSVFPVAENVHRNHILHTTVVPARVSREAGAEAVELARAIAERSGLVGLLAVELFRTAQGWLVNELAPRPHNSGHYSLDACLTSQFEQHIRAVCGLPPGETRLLSPVAMVNLLGDLWANGEPDWAGLLRNPRAKLHLYGKTEARPGRKMGHVCVLAGDAETAFAEATAIEAALRLCP
ncbi:MAG: 5-(carboxyamino)imidazole ribonucleotide synthase [Opitutales bacterium]|nr:5-(carboxyamino)imidazole ribonucleotide synthase [Opitutales bacterium]